MNYSHVAILVTGFVLSVTGFVLLGKKLHPVITGLIFLSGIIGVALGVLLICVTDFFSG